MISSQGPGSVMFNLPNEYMIIYIFKTVLLFDEAWMFALIHMKFNFLSREKYSHTAITEERKLCIFLRGTAKFLEPLELSFVTGCGVWHSFCEAELGSGDLKVGRLYKRCKVSQWVESLVVSSSVLKPLPSLCLVLL